MTRITFKFRRAGDRKTVVVVKVYDEEGMQTAAGKLVMGTDDFELMEAAMHLGSLQLEPLKFESGAVDPDPYCGCRQPRFDEEAQRRRYPGVKPICETCGKPVEEAVR